MPAEPVLALVTGASSGIGAAFARALAAEHCNLILTARREQQLRQLADELRQNHRVEVQVVMADLSEPGGVATLEHLIGATRVALLVNNAGFGVSGNFGGSNLEKQLAMVHVHIDATLRLCHAALPGMIERRRGGIINVASVAAFLPMPGNANYAATKAHLVAFSQALHSEVAEFGVKVQALCPGFTRSSFHDTPEYAEFDRAQVPRPFWMEADQVVAASLQALRHNKPVCIPGAAYQTLSALTRQTPAGPLILKILQGKRRKSQER